MPKLRQRRIAAMICFSISLSVSALIGVVQHRKLLALRQQYPAASLASRLNHEWRRLAGIDGSRRPALGQRVRNNLGQFERGRSTHDFGRVDSLRRIHSRQHARFVRAAGFGVGRMGPRMAYAVRPLDLEIKLKEIPFDQIASDSASGRSRSQDAHHASGVSDRSEQVHFASRDDFLNPETFGYVVEPVEQVVGFVEHALHDTPLRALPRPGDWKIERPELVSLLRFDEPRVYLLERMPWMDQLSGDDVATRPLDDFEATALERLWWQEDVVVASDGPRHRMLGSLRAASECLHCHRVNRGGLLGAFSYSFFRTAADEAVDDPR
ncbi:MAG: hypothetical protein AAF961_05695 [Planctomycetota bacterium]